MASLSTPSTLPFWSRARLALVGVALVLPAALLPLGAAACSTDAASGSGLDGEGGSQSTATGGGTGAGGNEADATVPDTQPDVTPPTYADLCGEGPCVPGPDDGCGIEGASEPGPSSHRGLSLLGCQVGISDDGEAASACVLAGDGEADAPCQGARDCRPGSACVPTEQAKNQASAGICRPYCCDDLEACGDGTYCAPRPLVENVEIDVPVCVAVTPCDLLDDSSCPAGTTCSVVRKTGATSCVEPGNGDLCEPCPCAAGFVCAVHTGLCQKLCRTDGPSEECGGGFCQGGSTGYPDGIGVCVGGDDEACSAD